MNNLTTRKIVLGMLMALVLVFSVQGVADAVSDPGWTLQTNADIITHRQVGITEFTVGALSLNGQKAGTIEYVTITISSGITLSEPFHSTTSITLTEKEVVDTDESTAGNQPGNGPLTYSNQVLSERVKGRFTTAGKKEVKVKGIAYDSDGDGTPWSYTFIYYVTQPTPDREKAFNLQNLTDGYYNKGNFDRASIKIHSTSGNFPVTYTVSGTDAVLIAEYPSGGRQPLTSSVLISSALNVYLQMGSATSVVTAEVTGSDVTTRGVYIYGFPTLTVGHPGDPDGNVKTNDDPTAGSKGAEANINLVIPTAFIATVKDGASKDGASAPTGVPDVVVKFQASGSRTAGGNLVFDGTNTGTLVTSNNKERRDTNGGDIDKILYVRTDKGTANVGFEFGTNEKQDVTISTVGLTRRVSVYTKTPDSGPQFTQQSSRLRAGKYDLRATVTDDGVGQLDQSVEFVTRDGTLITPATGEETESNDILLVTTNQRGEVFVVFDPDDTSGALRVTADLVQPAKPANTVAIPPIPPIPRKILDSITFDIRGGGSDPTNTITISLSSTTGEPGEEVTVSVASSPRGVFATLGSNDFGATRFSPQSGFTPFTSTLLLPVEEGTHSFFATGGVLTAGSASVTVETGILGTISISQIGTPSNGTQSFSITVVDTDSARISGSLTVRVSGSGFTTRNVDTLNGIGNARLTLPTAASLYTLTASAEGYTSGTTQVRIAGTGQQQVADEDEEEVEEEVTVAAEPDSIEITGPSTRSGTVDEELDTPLLVRVLDDDGDGLEGARVFYRVISGRGRLSARGNGRAIGVVTDSDGYARAVFTPLDGGTITVRANTDDLSATVTFTITTGSAPSASGARDSGTGGTPGMISPVVHVGAASRPPMLWVDGGAIYALVGASPQRFASSVDNALNITVAGGKVYWTEKTGESGGTINSANLNGSGVTELASIFATPMGIAVDVTNSKLYWTNSAGRIQSANLDGSRITNELQNLASPMDIALAGGNAYWTQGGNVRFVNLRGQKVVRNVSTGMDTAGSLAIGGGKVYWTEMTGESGGTVNSANLNGTGATQLASILAAPMGIAVDGSRSKLYWSNARGRIQSANLDGSGIKNVVSGLGSPGELVLSNSIATPTAATTTTRTTTTASKYDLNSDGTVDNTDAGLVADAMGTSNARYDVNGDGTVNFLDLLLVFDNRDAGAAGAPTVVGMKLSAAQIDIIEEQIDLLIATNDRSPSAMRVLVYLQQLLVTARPEKTQLLANYPNPFNPETWIPYELATDTHVRITIYNTQGVVIRSLQFGHQSAGYYVGRDRAAYWDGRNALGEQVASGLYFYQLETDEMSLMRKMVILK